MQSNLLSVITGQTSPILGAATLALTLTQWIRQNSLLDAKTEEQFDDIERNLSAFIDSLEARVMATNRRIREGYRE